MKTAQSTFQATIGVKYAEPDYIYRSSRTNDPVFDEMWMRIPVRRRYAGHIKAVPVDVTTGSRNVIGGD